MNLIFGKLKKILIFCKLKNAQKAILLPIIFTKGLLPLTKVVLTERSVKTVH